MIITGKIFHVSDAGGYMKIKLLTAVAASRITALICRIVRHGGTSLPGKVALKIYPGLIEEESAKYRTIIVTGTNGKTTTTKMISDIMSANGTHFITNKSGANLKSGIAATFAENALRSRHGTDEKWALLETDEAAFGIVSRLIHPDFLVVTNFFRDQLDRYGELYTTLDNVRSGIADSPSTTLILNADDSLCASLGKDIPNKAFYFGFSPAAAISGTSGGNNTAAANYDDLYCLYCKTGYVYSFGTYGHLGGFKCPSCGYSRREPDVSCIHTASLPDGRTQSVFSVSARIGSKALYDISTPLTGLYNVYNTLAAFTCSLAIPLPAANAIKAVASFESGFGRMETIAAGAKTLKLILVKNPTGFNQALSLIKNETRIYSAAFIINDNIADGTDISWLWDVDFENYASRPGNLIHLAASGTRAEDMAVRLKYAGFDTSQINIIYSYPELIDKGLESLENGGIFYIFPTYTALLDLRKKLKVRYKLKNFWE